MRTSPFSLGRFGYAPGGTIAVPRYHYQPIGLCTDGDSITNQGPSAPYYPSILVSNYLAANFGTLTNIGVTGEAFTFMVTGAQANAYPVMKAAKANGWLAVASCFGGTNDIALNGATGAQVWASATSYFTSMKKYGLADICIGWTILPRNGSNATETANFNSLMRSGYKSIGCDYVLDIAANPTMGNAAAPSNTSWFTDGTHPTTPGMTLIALQLYCLLMSINATTRLTSVSPSSGSLASPQTLSFVGSGFTGASTVMAGGLQCTGVTVNSDTSITATIPAGTYAGAGDCAVVSPTGGAILPGAYSLF